MEGGLQVCFAIVYLNDKTLNKFYHLKLNTKINRI